MHFNESKWKNMTEQELEVFKKEVFDHYRKNGFPYYNDDLEKQKKSIKKMDEYFKTHEVIKNDVIRQTMHCLSTAWTYFPHAWGIKCNRMNTPMEIFSDDVLFKKAITRRLIRGTYVSDSGIRKALRGTTGAQAVSNFRPSASRAIYDKYGGDGVTWDPSAGFGGRLLGAISSPRIKKYIGCEPSTKTFMGLKKMALRLGEGKEIKLYQIGSEEFALEEPVDLVFTSPPYFDNEIYSDEETQSCNRYPKYEDWRYNYLYRTMISMPSSVKKGGYLIINIANTKRAPTLVKDFTDWIDMLGYFKLEKELKLALSSISHKDQFKYEPVFVYKKL